MHLTATNSISAHQHGFLSGRSCSTNLLAALEDWTSSLDEKIPVDTIYLDFAKAFDSVPHKRLLYKLQKYGINGSLHKWIEYFLINRRQCVSVKGEHSGWVPVKSGIPQGSVLGPVLFVIFINDLPDIVKSTSSIFADDTKIYRTIQTPNDADILQMDIDSLTSWADTWQMRFNPGKCKLLHLGRSNPEHSYEMENSGERVKLEKSTLEKDLGVHVDKDLKFSKHIEIQVNKANKILGLIRRSYDYLDADCLKRLFIALVRPVLEYCNVAWSPILQKDRILIEGVQRRATKMVPGMCNLEYEERLKQLDLYSMSFRRVRGDMIEVYKYVHNLYKTSSASDLLPRDEPRITRGHEYKLKKQRCVTTLRQNFFSIRIIDSWNALPSSVVTAPNLDTFKNRLDNVWSHSFYNDVKHPVLPR